MRFVENAVGASLLLWPTVYVCLCLLITQERVWLSPPNFQGSSWAPRDCFTCKKSSEGKRKIVIFAFKAHIG